MKRSYSGAVSMPNANDGAPPVSIDSPFGLSSLVWKSVTEPVATSTPSTSADLLEDVLRDRRGRRLLALEADAGVLAGDDRVRLGVRLDEDRVERLVDRVREHVGAAHHRDAEDDRDRGQHRPELAPGNAAERDPDHRNAISSTAAST